MHVLTVIAEDLSPAHLLAAIKHWVAKFEQEIRNLDGGPAASGHYAFEHDGVPTEVHWNPQPGSEPGSEPGSVTLMTADNPPATEPSPEPTVTEPEIVNLTITPAAADPTEAAERAAADPESTGADVHAAIAPDAA